MWSKLLKPTGSTLIAFGLLLTGLVALVAGTVRLIERDRAELTDRFAAERLNQLSGATREIEDDLNDVAQDLFNVGHLVRFSGSTVEAQRILAAFIGSHRAYRAAAICDERGRALLTAWDPRIPAFSPVMAQLARSIATTARSVFDSRTDHIEPSAHIEGERGTSYRVFATRLPVERSADPPRAIALLVDTLAFLGKLRLVAAAPESQLLVIGPDGLPLPMSSEKLRHPITESTDSGAGFSRFARLMELMRDGGRGAAIIEQKEATRLGLGQASLIVAYAPIRMKQSRHWSVATLTFTAALGDHEKRVNWHLGLISAGIALALLVFGSYVVVTSRRAAVTDERLRHTDELAHLHEKAEKILENIPTGVMVLSDQTVITAMNRALRLRLPITAVGATLADAFPRAPRATVKRILDLAHRAHGKGRTQSLRGEKLALFGEEGQYSLHAVPLEPHFPEARLLLVVEDVSAIRALESQLLHAEKLATVGVLAAGVAHEVGTPLGVVRGRAEYILGKLGTDHAQAESLRIIIEQIDRVTRIVQELLDFSRVERAAVAPVELHAMVNKVVDLLRYEAGRRHNSFEVKIPESLPPIAANADQLQQILVNLLMNACDACAAGGRVSITAQKGEDEGAASEWDHLRLEIADDGCGIPPENLHRVFDPFFTTKKRGQGTGLGLTIVSQIVRNHGALIDLRSEPGQGTQVTLLWPVMREQLLKEGAQGVG
jgi:signal transduction histidine kinase